MSKVHNKQMYSFCPNCGAPMEQERFSLVCRYCGTAVTTDEPDTKPINHIDTGDSRKHYDYISSNETNISQNQHVALQKDKKRYTITSTPFYANDGFLKPLTSIHWCFQFQCDGKTEKLLIGILGKRPASRMAIKLDEDSGVLALPLLRHIDGYTWFKLSEEQLLSICTAKAIDISTDLQLPKKAQFNELPIFAARFYNAAFNRMKFMYSTFVKLISDK